MKIGDLVRVKHHPWTLGLVTGIQAHTGRIQIQWTGKTARLGSFWRKVNLEVISENR